MADKKVFTISSNEQKTITLETPGEYEVQLTGEGATVVIKGVFSAVKKENKLVSVVIVHAAPHTVSETTLKGVARDSAQVTFKGKIIVKENCPQSNGFLTERVLLLSDTAHAQAVPELEIFTDDVKCSHAASISHIPESQLFYLMSRGLTKQAAEQLIVDGFLI